MEETGLPVASPTEERLRLIELGQKSSELQILKGISDLDVNIRTHFQRQDNANQLVAEATNRLTDTIETSFKEVLDSAVGRVPQQHMPADMVRILVRTLGGVIFFLTFGLLFALTGIQLRWFPDFHQIPQEVMDNRRYLQDLHNQLEQALGKKLPDPPKAEEVSK